MSGFPSFDAFFHAVHRGRKPFPWQSRLAATVVEGGWPHAIGLPTGLGKTACLDIALWSLAAQGDRPPAQRTAATRIWYVVDRRLLVDAAYDHGCFLARILSDPRSLSTGWSEPGTDGMYGGAHAGWAGASQEDIGAIRAVGDALVHIAAVGTEQSPLHIARLRGGAELGQRSPDPSQPTIIFSTVAMYGSRLLFRGYGSSTLMHSVDAALAATDALVLLDEAHLAVPLMRTCAMAAQCDIGDPSLLLPLPRSRPRLVALTATGEAVGARFDLDETDRANETVAQRIRAAKPTSLIATSKKDMPRELSRQAARLLTERPRGAGIVFCNTVNVARDVTDVLRREAENVLLLTGRMRAREADVARGLILDAGQGAPAGRDRDTSRDAGLVVVATQTLEVGADLDFDFLVTESAGARALIQRFGRLNRLGTCTDPQAVICHPADQHDQPPYNNEPTLIWDRLSAHASLDLNPETIADVIGAPQDQPERSGQLLPAHIWEYAKTSVPEPDETPPELFFAGFEDDQRRASVCWRSHIPAEQDDDRILAPTIRESEVVDVPLSQLRAFLGKAVRVVRLAFDGKSVESVRPGSLRPGDRIILPSEAGGYDHDGWNDRARDSVLDVAALDHRILWLDAPAAVMGANVPSQVKDALDGLQRIVSDDEDTNQAARVRELMVALCVALGDHPGHPWLTPAEWDSYRNAFTADLTPSMQRDGSLALAGNGTVGRRADIDVRADAFDELSFEVKSALLRDHQNVVGKTARSIAEKIGLPAGVVTAVQRAGEHHDIGKSDPRFQRQLRDDAGVQSPELLAKSGTRHSVGRQRAAGWPRGGRHEALSAMLLRKWFAEVKSGWDENLILHLVASHHGYGRPLVPAPLDPTPPVVTADIHGTKVQAVGDLSVVDWEQPRRFHELCERYGYWGLSLIEAVVRQADHATSRRQDSEPVRVA